MSKHNDDALVEMDNKHEKNHNLSMTAILAGWIMKNPIVFTVLCICYCGGTVIGFASFLELLSRETVSVTQLVTGLLGAPLLFTIYHAPFNLIHVLDNTIEELRDLINTKNELNIEVNRLKLVETGLQKSLSTMSQILIEGSDKQSKLQLALEHVYHDLASSGDKLAASSSEFMKSLLCMDELTQELNKAVDDNHELTLQLDTVLKELTALLKDQKQEVFNDKLHTLAIELDHASDGSYGLRHRLSTHNITPDDENLILLFLGELDQLLNLYEDIEKCHSDTKTRMKSRGLIDEL